MGPTFFGSSEQPLFGVYHPARGARVRDTGIVFCNPAPQEYMRTHWAFRRLAESLSKAGFPALRFDYFGSGDSAGDSDAGDLTAWRENIAVACRELRDVAAVEKLSLIGFRLGGALAAMAGVTLEDLVLWEPVVHGAGYLVELEATQQSHLELSPKPPWTLRARPPELLGLPLPRALEAEVRALDLTRLDAPRAARITLMVSKPKPAFTQLHEAWRARGATCALECVLDRAGAADEGAMQAALLSQNMLQAIVAHFV